MMRRTLPLRQKKDENLASAANSKSKRREKMAPHVSCIRYSLSDPTSNDGKLNFSEVSF